MDKKSLGPLPPAEWSENIADMSDSFAGQLNVYRTMAHHPELLRSWAPLRKHIVLENALGNERLEIAILRIAAKLGSAYEWEHHTVRSKKLGLEPDRIQSMKGKTDDLPPDDRLVAECVDALLADTKLNGTALEHLKTLVGTAGVLDLMATVGFYKTLGCIAETFEIPRDDISET